MRVSKHILNIFVTTFLCVGYFALPAAADEAELDRLFAQLQKPELPEWEQVEEKIWREWSESGSASMDLLLQRGREAMEEGNVVEAIGHFSALIDHAPEFAEAWNARATAFFLIEEFSLSIADIRQTLALNPRHFGALQGLGRILEQLEDDPNALKAYQAAYAIHPHRPELKATIDRLERQVSGETL
ncbi:tetratricopeptide repeat protein [Litoreibacter roseus]|uniref:Uncharacterized protein n=1 Tax=Litoreibacter roseus TaxID=2601869 RepID=A0A6N6JHD5_9RHOB|nr:tetratricopeptide repeat protein [Litoreibacter roseus]GFE65741.1 hypothetical protein KIN_28150 [Litoreibacter roseus]